MDTQEIDILEPKKRFWQVTVTVDIPNEDTGKIKKTKEIHLVDAVDLNEIQSKVMEAMKGTMYDWEVTDTKQSAVQIVY